MKVLLLGNPESAHTIKWAEALAVKGVRVYLLSLNRVSEDLFAGHPNIKIKSMGLSNRFVMQKHPRFLKIIYLRILPEIKRVIRDFKPDILHSHYVSSYGLLGALTGFHPYLISIWGSDIYRFPYQSWINRALVQYSLNRADTILSTSNNMVYQVKKFTSNSVKVIPFGIDTDVFRPINLNGNGNTFVIGTVKHLKKIYGIDILVKAFKNITDKNPGLDLNLLIVGEGRQRKSLEKLADKLGISQKVEFAGDVDHEWVPYYINRMDVFAALSVCNESFGVSVLEAGACQKPVVVSDVSGFNEIVKDHYTGLVVPRNEVSKSAEAIHRLIYDNSLRNELGKNARNHVEKNYGFHNSINCMLKIYNQILRVNVREKE
ncbi:MAG: glycosyltransferase [Bacteroidota bacterium]